MSSATAIDMDMTSLEELNLESMRDVAVMGILEPRPEPPVACLGIREVLEGR